MDICTTDTLVLQEVDSKTNDSQQSLIKKTSSPKATELEPAPKKKTKQELFSDSDSDDETARFDKFSNSENKSKGDLLVRIFIGGPFFKKKMTLKC